MSVSAPSADSGMAKIEFSACSASAVMPFSKVNPLTLYDSDNARSSSEATSIRAVAAAQREASLTSSVCMLRLESISTAKVAATGLVCVLTTVGRSMASNKPQMAATRSHASVANRRLLVDANAGRISSNSNNSAPSSTGTR